MPAAGWVILQSLDKLPSESDLDFDMTDDPLKAALSSVMKSQPLTVPVEAP